MSRLDTQCGLDVSFKIIGGKWKPLILFHIQGEPKRFSEVKRRVDGISEKVLIQQLRELVAMNVLVRRDYHVVPPMVDYTLTSFGETLVQALIPLCEWGNRNREQVKNLINKSEFIASQQSVI